MPNPFFPYILLFLGSYTSIYMFWNFYDFGETQATLIYFKNITTELPSEPLGSITSSLKIRVNELYPKKTEFDVPVDPSINQEFNYKFYQEYMRANFGKYSKTNLFVSPNQSLSLIGINSEWSNDYILKNEVLSRMTEISMLCLNEEKLFGYNLSDELAIKKEWRYNFYHKIEGLVEAHTAIRRKKIMALGLYNPNLSQRMIRYYDQLTCNYSEARHINTLAKEYCNAVDYNCKGCHHINVSKFAPNEYEDFSSYEDIPIPQIANETIVNIAIDKDLIVFTTENSFRHIHYMFKDSENGWIYSNIEYDDDEEALNSLNIFQNLGIQFIGNNKDERILLIVDIEGNDEGLNLVYTAYKFAKGEYLLSKNNSDTFETYNFNVTNETLEEATKDIKSDYVYASSQYLLTQTSVKNEIFEYSPDLAYRFKKSIILNHSASGQILIVSLEKYVLLITLKDKYFGAYELDFFEDSLYKVKEIDISYNGNFFAFLCYYKDNYRVYVLFSEYIDDINNTEMFKIDFDYTFDRERNDLKDIKFIANSHEHLALLVMFTSGEIATYNLDFMPSIFGDFLDVFFDDDVSTFSFFAVVTLILMFITRRLRPRVIRIPPQNI